MLLRVCLLVGMLGASAISSSFHYHRSEPSHKANDTCSMCYGIVCFTMDHSACPYYSEIDNLLEEVEEIDNNTEINTGLDDMIHKLITKASKPASDCIPLISSYTDCHKENICTGCRSCQCDVMGRWNCRVVQKCREDSSFDVNHRLIVTVIENLMNSVNNTRFKRSVPDKKDVNKTKISFKEISQWFYDVKPMVDQIHWTTTEETQAESFMKLVHTTSNNIIIPPVTEMIGHDYIAFDEVLNDIAIDSKNYTRKKLPLDSKNDTTFFDYMIFDDLNKTIDDLKSSDEFWRTSNAVIMDNDITTSNATTEVIIDLLKTSGNNSITGKGENTTDYMDDNEINNYLNPVIENNNYIELNAVNVMKRDTSNLNTSVELKNDVLVPLSNLINVKQKELEDLLHISENLIKYMESNNEGPSNSTEPNEIGTNSTINIYKLEIVPEFDNTNDLRRTNTNILEKMLYKIKRDVYEVIRDIVTVQRYTNLTKLPQSLKILIRAMKNYVRSQKDNLEKESYEISHSRRYGDDIDGHYSNTVINDIVNVLEIIDKNKPTSNPLANLSYSSKKILKRIIKHNYVIFPESDLKVFDSNYNLTNYLESIGLKWQEMTKYVIKSNLSDRLHALKLLHLILSADIEKINDALVLINSAHTRRISPIDSKIGNGIIDKMNNGLKEINDKIKLIIKLHNKRLKKYNITKTFELHKNIKKESFFKKIKNILRTSKKDIVSLMKRKIKKNKLVKELARQKLDDMTRRRFTEFEETMKKWQNNLNLTSRDKRSLRDVKYKNLIKNILPKYLRKKVNPAIVAENLNKFNSKQNKKMTKQSDLTTAKPPRSLPKSLVKLKKVH